MPHAARNDRTPRHRCLRLPLLLLLPALASGLTLAAATPTGIVRGIYCDPEQAVDDRPWAAYGSGYVLDAEQVHTGATALRCVNMTEQDAQGGTQTVHFNQDQARPLVVAGWARLEGLGGPASYHCSVYLDLELRDGQSWYMKTAMFDPAKTGWQYAEEVYTPPAPIVAARVYVFLREMKGTAWFDDIYVGEVRDAQGTRSPNLLKSPGFEPDPAAGRSAREEFFEKLNELGCNAFHFYRGVPWETVMAQASLTPPDERLLGFVQESHRRGFGVWLTVGEPWPPIGDRNAPEFPYYACVNSRWGEAYTRAVSHFARYGFDGIGVVPDEWTLDNGRAKDQYGRSKDAEVAAFYADLPYFCDCPVCRRLFQERYGQALPDVRTPWNSADPVWARLAQFRYDSTTAWVQRTVAAAKQANPAVITDTMICVLPVCSDDRLAAGAAWDDIGARTQLDCLQTDPYIQLHNYRGDSTHYYATETTLHLAAANWQRRAGVTLEASRLRDNERQKDPAEVYGAALSCLVHGAREFFWWHLNTLLGKTAYAEPEPPFRRVAAFYKVVQAMEPALATAAPAGDILVLYSRASEDTWDRLGAIHGTPKRGFIAHRNVLYFLLRRGYPFQLTFLDNPAADRLAAARVVLVPFPAALKDSEVATLENLARDGKTVVIMSELAGLDELGQSRAPALAGLFGGTSPALQAETPIQSDIGAGRAVFLGGDAAVRLFQAAKPVKDPLTRVPVPAFDIERCGRLDAVITEALGRPGSVLATPPDRDLEVTAIEGATGRLVLAINWDQTQAVDVSLRPVVTAGRTQANGYRIDAAAEVHEEHTALPPAGTPWTLRLAPQDALLLRLE
jgi:hypothetical protein